MQPCSIDTGPKNNNTQILLVNYTRYGSQTAYNLKETTPSEAQEKISIIFHNKVIMMSILIYVTLNPINRKLLLKLHFIAMQSAT